MADLPIYRDLFDFQREGVDFLAARRRAFLFDEMGLGKTPQFIRAADAVGAQRLLVVCVAIARENWARKIEQWGLMPRSVHVVEGRRSKIPASADAVIINYDIVGDHRAELRALHFDAAAIDEGQYLKNPTAKRTSYIYGKDGVLVGANRLWLLTGTPAKNHPGEMWTHLRTFFPVEMRTAGIPLSYDDFLARYCVQRETPYGLKIIGAQNLGELKAFLNDKMLRRTVQPGMMPDVIYDTVALPGAATPADLAELMAGEDLLLLQQRLRERGHTESQIDAYVGDLMNRATENARYRRLSGLLKAEPAARLIASDLDGGLGKVIVFAHHTEVIHRLEELLHPYGIVIVNGERTPKQKQQAIDAFQGSAATRVLIGQIDSVSTSIDLTASSDVVFVESSWVPDDNAQAIARSRRFGQQNTVRVRFLSLAGTIDEAITATLRRKTQMLAPLLK